MFYDYIEKISHVFLLPLQSKKTCEVPRYQTECIKEKWLILFVKYMEQASLPLDLILLVKRGFCKTHRYITIRYIYQLLPGITKSNLIFLLSVLSFKMLSCALSNSIFTKTTNYELSKAEE